MNKACLRNSVFIFGCIFNIYDDKKCTIFALDIIP